MLLQTQPRHVPASSSRTSERNSAFINNAVVSSLGTAAVTTLHSLQCLERDRRAGPAAVWGSHLAMVTAFPSASPGSSRASQNSNTPQKRRTCIPREEKGDRKPHRGMEKQPNENLSQTLPQPAPRGRTNTNKYLLPSFK